MRRHDAEHVCRLLAFAAGGAGPDEIAAIDGHLAGCPDCVADVEAFRGLIARLRRRSATGAATCLAPSIPDGALSRADAGRIERHIRGCADCGFALERWRRAARAELERTTAETFAARATSSSGVRRATFTAVAVLGIGILSWGVAAWLDRTVPGRAEGALDFLPTRRATTTVVRAEAGRPYAIRVLLPYGAPRTTYRLRIRAEARPDAPLVDARVTADGDGVVRVVSEGFASVGRYRLDLSPAGSDEPIVVHRLDVVETP